MKLDKTDLVFLVIASVAGSVALIMRGAPAVIEAAQHAGGLLLEILPQLAAGLLIGGLVTRLVSRDRVAQWLGGSSGMTGLAIASVAGLLTPGGPFTSFPLVYALYIAGADAGALIAFITAWSLLGFNRLIIWELTLLGSDFALLRYAACLPMPIIAGLIARWLARWPVFRLDEPGDKA